jgi:hypothetical protein
LEVLGQAAPERHEVDRQRSSSTGFSVPGLGPLHDPRKNAVSVTFVGHLHGTPTVQRNRDGATAFAWFSSDQLDDVEFGFGQRWVIDTYLNRL